MKDVTTINRYDLLSDVRNSTSYFPYFVDDLWLSLMCSNGPFSYHNHVYCSIIKIVCQQKNHLWTVWETVSLIKKFCKERSQKREKSGNFTLHWGTGVQPLYETQICDPKRKISTFCTLTKRNLWFPSIALQVSMRIWWWWTMWSLMVLVTNLSQTISTNITNPATEQWTQWAASGQIMSNYYWPGAEILQPTLCKHAK